MFKAIKYWFLNLYTRNTTHETVVETVHRIPRSTYEKGMSKLPNTYVGSDSNEIEAAFKLGVAHAKETFEREFVV